MRATAVSNVTRSDAAAAERRPARRQVRARRADRQALMRLVAERPAAPAGPAHGRDDRQRGAGRDVAQGGEATVPLGERDAAAVRADRARAHERAAQRTDVHARERAVVGHQPRARQRHDDRGKARARRARAGPRRAACSGDGAPAPRNPPPRAPGGGGEALAPGRSSSPHRAVHHAHRSGRVNPLVGRCTGFTARWRL